MSAPNREQIKNNAFTTLNGAINNSVTTITVNDGSVFPAIGNYRIIIEDEIILVTARSTHVLTVVRGQEGTAADSHSDSSVVTHIITAGSTNRFGIDNDALWGSDRPALGRLVADDGTTILTSSDFTADNASGVTVADHNGTISVLKPTHSGESVTSFVRTAPSAPYVYQAAFQCLHIPDDGGSALFISTGLVLRKNSDSKMYGFGVVLHSTVDCPCWAIYKWNNATSFNGRLATEFKMLFLAPIVWMRIEDNNTDVKFYMSMDGIVWIMVASEARTTFMTGGPDRVGFFMSNSTTSGVNPSAMRLLHWSRVS